MAKNSNLSVEPRTEGAHGLNKSHEAAWQAKNTKPAVVKEAPPPEAERGRYQDILDVFKRAEIALSHRGAALLASHLLVECGDLPAKTDADGKRTLMNSEDLKNWALTFKKRAPAIWYAVARGDIRGFCNFLHRYGIEHESFEDCQISVNKILKSSEHEFVAFPKMQPPNLEKLAQEFREAVATMGIE